MSQLALLTFVVEALEGAGVDYMMTGSLASSLHGEPRSTHDLDVVVELRGPDQEKLLAAFPPPRFYVSQEAVAEAIEHAGMFNVIDVAEGDKIDFWLLTEEPFDQSRFTRRWTVDVFGLPLKVSGPEDTILAKLWWSELSGGSEKAYTDALRVFEVQRETLDLGYLEHWVRHLGVGDIWTHLLKDAG